MLVLQGGGPLIAGRAGRRIRRWQRKRAGHAMLLLIAALGNATLQPSALTRHCPPAQQNTGYGDVSEAAARRATAAATLLRLCLRVVLCRLLSSVKLLSAHAAQVALRSAVRLLTV